MDIQSIKDIELLLDTTRKDIGIEKTRIPEAQANTEKNWQMGPQQANEFLHSKESLNKAKRQLTEREKTLANYATIKGLISRISTELKKLYTNKPNNAVKTWAKGTNMHLSKCEMPTDI